MRSFGDSVAAPLVWDGTKGCSDERAERGPAVPRGIKGTG